MLLLYHKKHPKFKPIFLREMYKMFMFFLQIIINKVITIMLYILVDEMSPIMCSPEEIEQKRLQALAKLQAKKNVDIIERNRKEAIKRLQMNKLKKGAGSRPGYFSRTQSH